MGKHKKPDNLPAPTDPQPPDPQSGPTEPAGQLSVAASKTEVFLGPLPPPEYLKQYDEVCPGAAQAIFDTFQQLIAHQMEMEKQALKSDTARSSLGVAAGFVIAMTLIIGGIFAICLGHDWAGATVIVSCIVGLAGVFVYGTRTRRKQDDEGKS